ncbi:hypothetical protein M758_3G236300 [Ceratodon purpureus]|nr:hypothetical protein M758_3G236300 [Ceratodon purpureus]
MRRAWKCVQGRARQDRRNSCFAGVPGQGLHKCSADALASTSCPCSSTEPIVGRKVISTTQKLRHYVAPSCSSSPSGMPPVFQRRFYPVVEFYGQILRHEPVNERNFRIKIGGGFFFDITRGFVSASRGFSSGHKLHSAVRHSHASYASAAASAVERDYVDTSTSIPADVVIQPSLAGLELVDVTESLSALEAGTLSHVLDLEAKLRCLRDWGLTDEELAKLRLHVPSSVRSALLKNSAKKLVEVATFLVEECGVPKLKVADALLGNVFLASSRIEDCLRPKATYLLSLGITKEQVGKIIDRCPQILTYSMEQRVLPIQRKLIECGLKMEDIGKAVMKYPGLLGTGINKIDRTIQFLKAAGVVEIAKCICRHPQILSLSLDGKVHNMTSFLKSDLLLDTEVINKTISLQPSIFTYSVEHNLRPKVIYFLSLGLERREIGRMIAVHPAIMGHSLETSIKPKIDFLVNVMHRTVNEIVSFPQYLSYSLVSRIQPRYKYLAEKKIHLLSLSSMLSCRPDIFQKRYSSGYEPATPQMLAHRARASRRQRLDLRIRDSVM